MTSFLGFGRMKGTMLALATAMAAISGAQYTNYTTHYFINPQYEVSNIIMNEQFPNGGGAAWATDALGGQTTEVDLGWSWAGVHTPSTAAIGIGLAQDLPGDAPGQQHVVLLMDPTAALYAQTDWGTLFPNTDEDTLISNIELYTSGQDWPIIQPGIDAVNQFLNDDAVNGIMDQQTNHYSAWFTPGGNFDIVSWSNGQIIGTGTSTITSETFPVPEPASMAALAIGSLAILRRRRSSR